MFLSSLYAALRAKHNLNLADHRDVLSPDLFSHSSRRACTSRSDLLKLPIMPQVATGD